MTIYIKKKWWYLLQSEDIRLLRTELETGYHNLERIAMLRDECASLAWRKEEFKTNNR